MVDSNSPNQLTNETTENYFLEPTEKKHLSLSSTGVRSTVSLSLETQWRVYTRSLCLSVRLNWKVFILNFFHTKIRGTSFFLFFDMCTTTSEKEHFFGWKTRGRVAPRAFILLHGFEHFFGSHVTISVQY